MIGQWCLLCHTINVFKQMYNKSMANWGSGVEATTVQYYCWASPYICCARFKKDLVTPLCASKAVLVVRYIFSMRLCHKISQSVSITINNQLRPNGLGAYSEIPPPKRHLEMSQYKQPNEILLAARYEIIWEKIQLLSATLAHIQWQGELNYKINAIPV